MRFSSLDDRSTAYTASTLARLGLDGGKMLARMALDDPGTANTLEACGRAVTEPAQRGLMAMVEPFMSRRGADGRVVNRFLDPDSVITSVQIASARPAPTWPALPVVAQMHRGSSTRRHRPACSAATRPTARRRPRALGAALQHSAAAGLVVGRALLFPADDDVASAVDRAADLVHGGAR